MSGAELWGEVNRLHTSRTDLIAEGVDPKLLETVGFPIKVPTSAYPLMKYLLCKESPYEFVLVDVRDDDWEDAEAAFFCKDLCAAFAALARMGDRKRITFISEDEDDDQH